MRCGNAADVGGDGGDCLKLLVPLVVHGVPGQFKGRGGQLQQPVGVVRVETAIRGGPVRQVEQFLTEQLPGADEFGQLGAQFAVKEPRILGRQHGGEDTERILGQLSAIDRAEGRRDHGHGA